MNKIALIIVFVALMGVFVSVYAQKEDWRNSLVCADGEKKPCGSNIGICKTGERTCIAGAWGDCIGAKGPEKEICNNGLDDDCNGQVDDCYFEFPVPGWVLISAGVLMFLGAYVYEKMVVVKREEENQEEPE